MRTSRLNLACPVILISSYFSARKNIQNWRARGLLVIKLSRCTALWKVKAAWPLRNISGSSIEFELCCSLGALQVRFSVLSIEAYNFYGENLSVSCRQICVCGQAPCDDKLRKLITQEQCHH